MSQPSRTDLQDELSPRSVKQYLAALRMLFDWLVTGHVIDNHSFRATGITAYLKNSGELEVAQQIASNVLYPNRQPLTANC
jgi:hypothetical protein